jgi:spermidine/putrescine transport system ATP-binding protein
MREGRIVQVGSPRELYDRPSSRYVADFVGKSNFFDGTVEGGDGALCRVRLSGGTVIEAPRTQDHAPGTPVSISVRPEQLIMARDPARFPPDSALRVEARVLNRIFLGEHTEYLLSGEQLGEFLVLSPRRSELSERPFETGETVQVAWSRDAALILGRD